MIISADELVAALEGDDAPVVLDVRWTLGGGADRSAYDAGHIPGAVFVDFDGEICGPPGAGGRHPLPEPTRLQAALRRAGIDDGDSVVAVDGGDLMSAARTWWTLRWAGLDEVHVLDGGYGAWTGPLTTAPASPARGAVNVRPGSMPALDASAAAERVDSGVLVDVRTPKRFRGEHEPIDPVAGHIPGAVNVPDPVVVDGRLARAEVIRGMLDGLTGPIGAYCGSGVAAARMVLAAATAGIDADLYVGSWSDWISDPRRPIATGG